MVQRAFLKAFVLIGLTAVASQAVAQSSFSTDEVRFFTDLYRMDDSFTIHTALGDVNADGLDLAISSGQTVISPPAAGSTGSFTSDSPTICSFSWGVSNTSSSGSTKGGGRMAGDCVYTGTDSSGDHYDMSVLSLNMNVIDPNGDQLLFRESPTLQSTGGGNGHISVKSFPFRKIELTYFDISLDCSTDGGATWNPVYSNTGSSSLRFEGAATPELPPSMALALGVVPLIYRKRQNR